MTTTESTTDQPEATARDQAPARERSFAEIATKRFRSVWRGWDSVEARAFLIGVAESHERLLHEVRTLREVKKQVAVLEEELRVQKAWSRVLMEKLTPATIEPNSPQTRDRQGESAWNSLEGSSASSK